MGQQSTMETVKKKSDSWSSEISLLVASLDKQGIPGRYSWPPPQGEKEKDREREAENQNRKLLLDESGDKE